MRFRFTLLVLAPLLFLLGGKAEAQEVELFGWRGLHYLEARGVVRADLDPFTQVTRGEFTEYVTTLVYQHDLNPQCFSDLASSLPMRYDVLASDLTLENPHAIHFCVGLKTGIVRGKSNGTLASDEPITVAEASRILYRAYDVGPLNRQSLPGKPWYHQAMYDLDNKGILPMGFFDRPSHILTRGEAGEMLMRLAKHEKRLRQAGDLRVYRGAKAIPAKQVSTITSVPEMSTPAGAGTVTVIDLSHSMGGESNASTLGLMESHARGVTWIIPIPSRRGL